MAQPTLSGSGKSFLDLPAKVRRRIYIQAGIPIQTYLPMTNEAKSLEGRDIALSFLLVSRVVSKEVEHLLFSENTILVQAADNGLQTFAHLSDDALSSLNKLNIRLHHTDDRHCCLGCGKACGLRRNGEFYAHCYWCSCQWKKHSMAYTVEPSLSNARQQDLEMLLEWNAIIDRLAGNTSSDLHLQLLCDTEDICTAKEIVRPLDKLPTLHSFTIRLSANHSHSLRELAQNTLLRVTGKPAARTFHGYNRLPIELRMKILGLTDLVSPLPTHWHYKHKFFRTSITERFQHRRCECNKSPYRNCNTKPRCSCFCSARHTVASTSCDCYIDPQSIFRVSQQMNQEATVVFYSRNEFVLVPHHGREAELFFTHISRQALDNLASLKFITSDILRRSDDQNFERSLAWERGIALLPRGSRLNIIVVFKHLLFQNVNPWFDHRYEDILEDAWDLKRHVREFKNLTISFTKLELRGFNVEIDCR